MTVTKDDFEKVWASTSPLTPYAFSDAKYKEGWNFIGGTPPSRQMWDFLQKNNDEKMQYLANNYLPLSGGTVTGGLTVEGTITGNLAGNADTATNATNATNDANGNPIAGTYLPLSGGTMSGAIHFNGANNRSFGFDLTHNNANMDIGWNWGNRDGAGFGLRSTDDPQNTPGSFCIYARDGSNSTDLNGYPDGRLTWNDKEVERVNASGSNYIRYENGLQIVFDRISVSMSGAESTGTPASYTNYKYRKAVYYNLPATFVDNNNIAFANVNESVNFWLASVNYCNSTQALIRVMGNNDTSTQIISFIAVGRWK